MINTTSLIHYFKSLVFGSNGIWCQKNIMALDLVILNMQLAIQELAIVDPSIALSVAAHNSLCTGHILNHGNETQIKIGH